DEGCARGSEDLFGNLARGFSAWCLRVFHFGDFGPGRPGDPCERGIVLGAVIEVAEKPVEGDDAAFDIAETTFVDGDRWDGCRIRFLTGGMPQGRAELFDITGQTVAPRLPTVGSPRRECGQEELD